MDESIVASEGQGKGETRQHADPKPDGTPQRSDFGTESAPKRVNAQCGSERHPRPTYAVITRPSWTALSVCSDGSGIANGRKAGAVATQSSSSLRRHREQQTGLATRRPPDHSDLSGTRYRVCDARRRVSIVVVRFGVRRWPITEGHALSATVHVVKPSATYYSHIKPVTHFVTVWFRMKGMGTGQHHRCKHEGCDHRKT